MSFAHRTFIALAAVGASCSFALAACGTSTTSPDVTSADRSQIAVAEARKWDMFFGSAAQRDSVRGLFASTCLNVGVSGTSVTRITCAEAVAALASIPTFPAGTFAVSNMQVLEAGDGALVTSYQMSGPGPTGALLKMWVSSVWVRQGGAWKTVYYQASPGAQ